MGTFFCHYGACKFRRYMIYLCSKQQKIEDNSNSKRADTSYNLLLFILVEYACFPVDCYVLVVDIKYNSCFIFCASLTNSKEKIGMKLRTIMIVATFTALLGIAGCSQNSDNKSTNSQAKAVSETENLDYYVIPDADKQKIKEDTAKELQRAFEAVDEVYKNNGVLKVVVGAGEDAILGTDDDNYIIQMYNAQGQCYSEANNNLVSFYYDRGKSVMFSNKVEETPDVTILDLVTGALNLCNAGVEGCTVDIKTQNVPTEETESIKVDVDNTGENTGNNATSSYKETLLTLKITGLDNIEKVYSQFSKAQGEDIRKSWLGIYGVTAEDGADKATNSNAKGLTKEELNERTAKDSMTLSVYLTDVGDFSVSSSLNINSQEYTSWVFDGYTPLSKSWTAGDGWETGLSDEEYLNLISKVQDNISESMKEWSSQHKEDTSNMEQEETASATDTTSAEATEITDSTNDKVSEAN